ncbi:heparinase II/III domain-containing protein [Thalassotalea hakodatensis]|uniref:heparinase II/III domain-containing protein n=1 Tax=Thalassotalea hakodatensis TaxID=3030492 RepID=UPI002573C636|nr:heparinase II/III family protein [Thalassotalea hakodatensis]
MTSLFVTYLRLGIANLFAVALYRFKVKRGYFDKIMPVKNHPQTGQYFTPISGEPVCPSLQKVDNKVFGWLPIDLTNDINWLSSITNHKTITNNQVHWSKLNDFDLNVGDIKAVWEMSRFNWLFALSIDYLNTHEQQYLARINHHLINWQEQNPTNQGVHWKCGQEASIRLMHLAASAHLLQQDLTLAPSLKEMLFAHLQRIAPTMSYAIAQDNNHGTSEGAALFIGSAMLLQQANIRQKKQLKKWLALAVKTIENRCDKLIADDGCFSQYSTNYHRLMLDSLSLVEFFRQKYQLPTFSKNCYKKLQLATLWLQATTCQKTGKTPILGLNDGAQLLTVTSCDYLDFRPSVQWAFQLFFTQTCYSIDGTFNQLARLFPAQHSDKPAARVAPAILCSDYHLLHNDEWCIFIRTPTAKFRPSQCDALHIDLWHKQYNIFIGSGSYSYNCEPKWQDYFPSVKAQNTVSFDNDEQMPKLSRFLYTQWIKANTRIYKSNELNASYQNKKGHFHHRKLVISNTCITIEDRLKGFKKQATLRWHIPNDNWQLTGNTLQNKHFIVRFSSNVNIEQLALVDGWQSRYYLKKDPINILELTIVEPGIITTTVSKVE